MMLDLALTAILFVVAASSSVCARLTRPDRNYYPMQRVVWAVLGFVYGGSGIARLTHPSPAPPGRAGLSLAFSAAILVATSYSIVFMVRRNRTARYIPLTLAGQRQFRPVEELERIAALTESWAVHGEMPPAIVARLRAALDEGERKRRWADEDLPRQLAARRARRKGGIE